MAKHRIAVIPGDGIGREVVPEGLRAIAAAGDLTRVDFLFQNFDWSCEYNKDTGAMMPGDGIEREFVTQQAVFTRKGCDRIIRYAFELSQAKGKTRVDGATKSNGIFVSMPYWDQRFNLIAAEYSEIDNQLHIDILCARLVMRPEKFEVIVATNLFGDILSDLGPGVTGAIAAEA